MADVGTVRIKNGTGQQVNPSTEETLAAINDTLVAFQNTMAMLIDRLEYGSQTDIAKRLRIIVDSVSTGTIATVTTCNTVSNLTNLNTFETIPSKRLVEAQIDAAFALGIVNNVTF